MTGDETGSGEPAESFASYLARYLRVKRGFHTAVPPEAEALVPACNLVLVCPDPTHFQIACIVDREAYPDEVFGLTPDETRAVAQACRTRVGRFGSGSGRSGKAPVSVTVYEVGPAAASDDAMRRLAGYRRAGPFSKAWLRAVAVDPGRGIVRPNPGWPRFSGLGWLRGLVRDPRVARWDAPPAVADLRGVPLVTVALLAILAAVFAGEVGLSIDGWTGPLQPGLRTLLAFGGVSRSLVQGAGEWWRLLTAPMLHADAFHLLCNGLALLLIGRLSERLMGPAWFAATFVVSALCGSALSIGVNAPNLLSVGASGAIVGLFAATSALSFRFPSGPMRSALQVRTLQTLIPALLPIFSGGSHANIDYGAHIGGAAGGLASGLLMLALWRRSAVRPRLAALAGAVGVLGLAAAAAAAAGPGLRSFAAIAIARDLVVPWPTIDGEARRRSAELVAAKPRDPRAHLARGLALADGRDLAGAEGELRRAIADPAMLALMEPHFEARVRSVLGELLRDMKRPDDARAVLAPACAAEKSGPLRDAMDKGRLCV